MPSQPSSPSLILKAIGPGGQPSVTSRPSEVLSRNTLGSHLEIRLTSSPGCIYNLPYTQPTPLGQMQPVAPTRSQAVRVDCLQVPCEQSTRTPQKKAPCFSPWGGGNYLFLLLTCLLGKEMNKHKAKYLRSRAVMATA